MCGGASATQDQLQSEEASFYQTQVQAYNTAYKNFSDLSATLNAQFAPILAAGPNQMGFNDAELTNLDTTATEGTAQGYAKAKQALQENVAAQGGGMSNINLTSGATEQEQEELASTAAGTESAEKLGIQQAGYSQGYNEWENAVQGTESLAAGWNPNSFSSSANSAAQTANTEANTITQENNSVWTSVIGALGGIAGSAAGGWALGKSKG
jgi:hypothetical protein